MNLDQKLFSKRILLFHQNVETQKQIFEKLNEQLLAKNVVKPGFLEAIEKREKEFPTGLAINKDFGVAIPHTDSKYINEDQIGFMSLNNAVSFRQMGSDTETTRVKMVFILCLKEAHKQLDMLQNLMALFGNDQEIKNLYESNSENEFLKLIC